MEPMHIIVNGNVPHRVDRSSRFSCTVAAITLALKFVTGRETRKRRGRSDTYVVDYHQSKELSHTWKAPLNGHIPSPRYHSKLPNHPRPSLQVEVPAYFPINTKSHITSTYLLLPSPTRPHALLSLVPSNQKIRRQ